MQRQRKGKFRANIALPLIYVDKTSFRRLCVSRRAGEISQRDLYTHTHTDNRIFPINGRIGWICSQPQQQQC